MNYVLLTVALGCLALAAESGPPQDGSTDPRDTDPSEVMPPKSQPSRPWWHPRRLGRTLATAAVVVIVLSLLALTMEDKFIYHPTSYPRGNWEPDGLKVESCEFESGDGTGLHGWWHSPADSDGDNPRPVLFWCHGNAGNITNRTENMRMLADRGMAFFIFDYRGYGKSEGKPSEKGLYLDGEAAYRYLTEELGVPAERVVIFGRSLGSAVALHVALEKPCAGLILESAFTSVPAMARKVVPVLPLWRFMDNEFDNLEKVPNLSVPLLSIHGDADGLVPFRQGKAVYEAAPEPKDFYTIPGAGHNDTYLVGGDEYFQRLKSFCRECAAGKPRLP